MYSERLQILVSKDQRRLLEAEARRRQSSVAGVIRDAVEAQLGGVARADRVRAAEAIAAMRGAPYLPPEELARAIDEAHEEEIDPGLPREAGP